jgi:hypothetical protein
MSQFQDIIGSVVIGGIVMLMLLVFNGNVMESAGLQTFKTNVQSNLTAVTDILEYDMRKMGYRVSSPDSAIVYADTSKIKFKGDFNNDGTVDTLIYYIDTVGASLTPNPYDKVLRRVMNGQPSEAMFVGVVSFKIQYYDKLDSLIKITPVSVASKIKSLKISINMQGKDRIFDPRKGVYNGNPFNDTTYTGAYWERTIKPKNLR